MGTTVLITDCNLTTTATAERATFRAHGLSLVEEQCSSEDEVIAAISEVAPIALLVQNAPITARVLAQSTAVRVIVRYGIGLNNIDIEAAERFGIATYPSRGYAEDEVADHTLALLLGLARETHRWSRDVTARGWLSSRSAPPPLELAASTLGLLGLGEIGRRVALRGRAFGLEVIAHDPALPEQIFRDAHVKRVSWDELWASGTIVSLHVPLTDATRGVVDSDILSRQPGPAYLINTARAALIDRCALEQALAGERLRGVGLDVWWKEPPSSDDPLLRHPKVIVSPHVAWLSEASPRRLRLRAATQLLDALAQLSV